jgi:hypothetical protein
VTSSSKPSRDGLRLVLASGSALFLELVLIRWIGAEAPVLAYFKSFPLLAAFLGMGVGARLADRRDLALMAPLALLLLGLLLGRAGNLGAATLALADPNLEVWRPAEVEGVGPALAFGLVLLALMAAAFVALGQRVGRLVESAPALLRGYGLDLLGGLIGALASLALASLPPASLLPLGAVLFALASANRRALVVSLATFVVPFVATPARWSPYYRIDLEPHVVSGVPLGERLSVNRDVHQLMLDLSDETLRAHEAVVAPRRRRYALPWSVCALPENARVLVAGAGTGNDVAEALRHGPRELVAVELDPTIAAIGSERHPEHPYSGPVTLVADDARAAFERLRHADFDVLVYGLIDAHASLAAFGSLRHEEFVYTVEGIEAGLATLDSHGVACMTFFERGRRWLGDRITASITAASGTTPIVTMAPREGTLYFFFGPGLDREGTLARLASIGLTDEGPERLARGARPTTDDWPFLYANPDGPPLLYLSALAALVAGTLATVLAIRGRAPASGSDLEMVLLGAAFLLVETTRITELARLFGATWIVSGIVIAGIFLVLVVANAIATYVPARLAPLAGLAAALALVLPTPDLLTLPPVQRAVAAGLLAALPLGFAGIAFSRAFATVPRGASALGANLAGAALGGGLESLVLLVGLRRLAWLAAGLYAGWALLHALRRRR